MQKILVYSCGNFFIASYYRCFFPKDTFFFQFRLVNNCLGIIVNYCWQKIMVKLLILTVVVSLITRSRLELFFKKGVLRNFTKFTGKHLCQRLFFNKVAGLRTQDCNFIKKESLSQVFSCEFWEISKNTFFTEHSGGCFCLMNSCQTGKCL